MPHETDFVSETKIKLSKNANKFNVKKRAYKIEIGIKFLFNFQIPGVLWVVLSLDE